MLTERAVPTDVLDHGEVLWLAGFGSPVRVPRAITGGLEPRSVQSVHIMLNRAFADAVRWKYLSANPVEYAVRVRRDRKGHSLWTPQQLKQFLASAADDRLYAMWL